MLITSPDRPILAVAASVVLHFRTHAPLSTILHARPDLRFADLAVPLIASGNLHICIDTPQLHQISSSSSITYEITQTPDEFFWVRGFKAGGVTQEHIG